ncbi:MAG: aminoglycoside phosphotransferase family protein, partial [Gammaproteobacteria bacterium]
ISGIHVDASFRRYFRITTDHQSWVAMDAPPEKEEKTQQFVQIAKHLYRAGIQVPEIVAENIAEGLLLLTDFGDEYLLNALNHTTVDHLYSNAMQGILQLQSCSKVSNLELPHFDETHIRTELNLFNDWYLKQSLNINLKSSQEKMLEKLFQLLINNALSQPQVFTHRDYHSRNLMLLPHNIIGIIDFQDAVIGPITYDLVSLLKDCYIAWPADKTYQWVENFCSELLRKHKFSLNEFTYWFDLIGLQRHLKVIGIFSRLHIRDNKSRYLSDIPRIFNYIEAVVSRYHELNDFKTFLSDCILPLKKVANT